MCYGVLISFQRGQLFTISKVKAGIEPELFQLKDLQGDNYPGFYYRQQSKKSVAPNYKKDYFSVERVIKKKVKKEWFYYCKFLYYPPKFNMWINEKDLKFGKD